MSWKLVEQPVARGGFIAMIRPLPENGMWDASPSGAVTDDQIAAFADRLSGFALAHQHFTGMPRSARVAYVRRYLSFKKEETRQKDFEKIVALLQQNQKPTIQGKG